MGPPVPAGDGRSRVRILQVDDSAADLLAVRRALERDPDTRWELEQVMSAEEGLARMSAAPPDVALLDLFLPGLSGLELLRVLRERMDRNALAVVMFTGSGSESVAVEAMKAGAQDYLVKEGFTPERLRSSLRAALEAVRRERALEERRLQAERAEQAAREALAVRDELFALATHDLRGPLQHINLSARLLRDKLPAEALTPEVEARLAVITREAVRMGVLIDHFLEATRSQQQAPGGERVDLLPLVRAKVRELEGAAPRHTFRLHVEGTDFSGRWDLAHLERVLDNLLSNAVKYSPEGGPITVTLNEEGAGPGGHVRLCVEDCGLGIPAEDLPHIFERFHRGRNVADSISGTGVGLASVRRLVELHGGAVSVHSQQGRGAAFTVWLPRKGGSHEPAAPAPPDKGPP